MRELYIIGETPAKGSQDYLSAVWMCVCMSICEYRDNATSRETREMWTFRRIRTRAPPEPRTFNSNWESSVLEAWSRVARTPASWTWGTSRGMQMLHNKWPCPSHTKSLPVLLWKSAKTETLPNVPAGHAELRTDNSAAMIDGASEGTKGAHSLPTHESVNTCTSLRELYNNLSK